jgi:hypothetical protein
MVAFFRKTTRGAGDPVSYLFFLGLIATTFLL